MPESPAPLDRDGRRTKRRPGAGRKRRSRAAAPGSADPAERATPVEAGEPAPKRWRGFTLSDFQRQAVAAVRDGHNVLVGAPTGAGKTLVAEYAIEDAVRAGRRCIYTAPIKALSNQKYRDFKADPKVDVGLMTGDVTINPRAQVLVMTTEILRNTIFETPESLYDVEYVVFDEVHFLDDPERGVVWEEALIFAPERMRFICLSATISNIDELGAWIGSIRRHDLVVIESRKRPVPLEHKLYCEDLFRRPPRRESWVEGGVFSLADLPRARRALPRESDKRGRGGRSGRGRSDKRGRSGPPPGPPDSGPLLDQLQERNLLPALVFSFSRKDCERLARVHSARELLDDEERARIRVIQEELVELFQLEPGILRGELMGMARHGIAYHHAGMLPIHKELVERLFTSGLLKLLFTTETFALGINMPARSVVFASLRKFDGVSVDWLRTRDYLQMAGRAGRQGLDDAGLVFSMVEPRDVRQAPLERMLEGESEPVTSRFRASYSTILHLLPALGRERLHEAWEKSFHQFQNREGTEKQQEKISRRERRRMEARVTFLEETGFLDDGEAPSAKGGLARRINGCEIQLAELLWRGTLEELDPTDLALVFASLIHEDRRRRPPVTRGRNPWTRLAQRVRRDLEHLFDVEAGLGIEPLLKQPDWTLSAGVLAWCRGEEMERVVEQADVSPGDVIRTLRMSMQLARQVQHAIDPAWDLVDRLMDLRRLVDRDEVDARRQLELG